MGQTGWTGSFSGAGIGPTGLAREETAMTEVSRDVQVPPHPLLLELDTWPWLTALTAA